MYCSKGGFDPSFDVAEAVVAFEAGVFATCVPAMFT